MNWAMTMAIYHNERETTKESLPRAKPAAPPMPVLGVNATTINTWWL